MSEEKVFYKDYYKEKQIQLIKSIIPEDKYGVFTPLVYDILLRRAYTFEQSDEDIIRDAKKVMENITKIEFARKDQFEDDISVLGQYDREIGIIQLNADSYERNFNKDQLYEALTHEVYHAIATDKRDPEHITTGLKFFDEQGELVGTTFNEIFNEAAADLTAVNRESYEKQTGIHFPSSYYSISFFAPLLARIFGLSEKDLYKEGITDRKRFYEFLSSKLPEDKREDFIKSLDDMEVQLTTILSIRLKDDSEKLPTDDDDLEKCMESITKFSYQTLQTIIQNDSRINPITYKDYYYRLVQTMAILLKERHRLMLDPQNDKIMTMEEYNQTYNLMSIIKYISKFDSSYSNEEKKLILDRILSSKKEKPLEKVRDSLFFIDGIAKGRKVPTKFPKNIGAHDKLIEFLYIDRNFDSGKVYDNSGVHQMIDKAYNEFISQKAATIKPKDIAVADQARDITQEEIRNVEAVFRQISEMEKSSRGENPEHD